MIVPLPSSGLLLPGDLRRLRIDPEGRVTVFTGKVELGQGILTAFIQIVAEELDVAPERVCILAADTAFGPDEGNTASSRSVEVGGNALRLAAANMRSLLVSIAAARLGVAAEDLQVVDGTLVAPDGTSTDYWSLAPELQLGVDVAAVGKVKAVDAYRVVGSVLPRRDLPGKFTGAPSYLHDMELPGMLFGRVARPPGADWHLAGIDRGRVDSLAGMVAVVRDGSFLGVVAEREEQAIRGVERIRSAARWDRPSSEPGPLEARRLLTLAAVDEVVVDRSDPVVAARAARWVEAEYSRPFLSHGSIGPSCAVAWLDGGRMTVWTHSQGIFHLRDEIAQVLGMAPGNVRLIFAEGAGCYGHNGADDCALDAALLARGVPGRPVKVQWSRSDEFAWEPYGSAMLMRLKAGLDGAGNVVDWTHEVWSHSHNARPGAPGGVNLLAAWDLECPFPHAPPRDSALPAGGTHRNAVPYYDFPNQRVVSHFVPHPPRRVSSLRSLGAHGNVLAIEGFMDELAEAANADPVEFRLRHLSDRRARAVIEAVAERSGWANRESGGSGKGFGIGFARYKNMGCYVAVVVEVEAEYEVRITRAWASVDAGLAINPDGVANQVEGGVIQSASWALKESVPLHGISGLDGNWNDYPILTFPEVPEIDVQVLDRPQKPRSESVRAPRGRPPAPSPTPP